MRSAFSSSSWRSCSRGLGDARLGMALLRGWSQRQSLLRLVLLRHAMRGQREAAPPHLRAGWEVGRGHRAGEPEIGEGVVEGRQLLALGDEADLEEGVEVLAHADVDQRQALDQLDHAPRPDVQPQLPEEAPEVEDARQQQLATRQLHIIQRDVAGCGVVRRLRLASCRSLNAAPTGANLLHQPREEGSRPSPSGCRPDT